MEQFASSAAPRSCGRWRDGGGRTPISDVVDRIATADLSINMSGMLTNPSLPEPASRRVYLDLDPGYTQLWHEVDGMDMRLDGHTDFVTIGPAMADSGVPTLGRTWMATLQPIVLPEWPVAAQRRSSTVRSRPSPTGAGTGRSTSRRALRAKGPLVSPISRPADAADGRFRAGDEHSPGRAKGPGALRQTGWLLVDPETVADSPNDYRRFVQESRAELAIAKSGYVRRAHAAGSATAASVISRRAGRWRLKTLASRPTFQPDVAWCHFPLSQQAADAVREIRSDYGIHARAARAIAEEFFDSDRVLSGLLRQPGAAA